MLLAVTEPANHPDNTTSTQASCCACLHATVLVHQSVPSWVRWFLVQADVFFTCACAPPPLQFTSIHRSDPLVPGSPAHYPDQEGLTPEQALMGHTVAGAEAAMLGGYVGALK
jgi:hypothetical protein